MYLYRYFTNKYDDMTSNLGVAIFEMRGAHIHMDSNVWGG